MPVSSSYPNYFDGNETGAPSLNNVAGSVIEVLRACAVNGFNPRTVTSIDVASGVATATAASHGYSAAFGKLILIEGAPEALLNGRHQPLSVTTNTFTFDATGVADGTYTGTISAKRAPLGWEVAHINGAGTTAIFRRPALEASASMLRVVDTMTTPAATTYALASMVETATDADTVTGEASTVTAERVWMRGENNATAKRWVIAGNSLRAWILLQGSSSSHAAIVPYFYGDPSPLYVADAGRCLLATFGSTSVTANGGFGNIAPQSFALSAGVAYLRFQRTFDGLTVGVQAALCGGGSWGQGLAVAGASTPVAVVGDYYLKTPTEIRARLPELYLPQANAPFTDRTVYSIGGRQLLAITINIGNTTLGQMMLDLATPWE
jgi:hypothetical protein